MSETKETQYESVLIGWVDDPKRNEQGDIIGHSFRLKDNELKDVMDQYLTTKDDKGQGGNAKFNVFVSKKGKWCLSVWDPNSPAAQERRENKAKSGDAKSEDLPF